MKIEELTEQISSTATSSPEDVSFSSPKPASSAVRDPSREAQGPDSSMDADELLMEAFANSPAMAEMQGKTSDEILADLNKSPLFMTDLEQNDDIAALQALAYEGTALEVAQGFKERGNETFVVKSYKDAKEFYTQGINVILLEVRKRQQIRQQKTSGKEKCKQSEDDKSGKNDIKEQIKILEASLLNRAACNLELQNYRSCILDCEAALKINGKNVKAYYRSSKALLKLDKIAEADDSCAKGLELDPENKTLQGVAQELIKKNEIIVAKKKRDLDRESRKRLEEVTLKAAIKARGIKIRRTEQPPEVEDAKIQLVPDPVDPTSTLSFPAVLLYPLQLESDFIKAWGEMEPMGHHLDYILPVPWDKTGEYIPAHVECYMETVKGGLIKVGRKVTLLKVLSTGNVEVVDEVVKVFVVPSSKAAAWVTEFKSKKTALA
ncbi:hypothetical protein BJ878DRAFT_135522 [Calycina marina]|uniref:Cns1/TTC4 wheel domain-containing protein n=1 Tax=Calycina marina TaxID=1763456 RepID=A0A9P7Z970_9HELO|nr:hypothetical protein BJ878DRAFT_135522 [Calycina marina]